MPELAGDMWLLPLCGLLLSGAFAGSIAAGHRPDCWATIKIRDGRGFGIDDARQAFETVYHIRNTAPQGLKGDHHPLCAQIRWGRHARLSGVHGLLLSSGGDRARFRLIVDAIRELEEAWPRPGEIARSSEVRESELRLQKEIKEVELRLQKEIKEIELRLQKESGQIRVDLEQVRVDLKSTEANIRTAMHRQTVWIIGAIGAVTGLIRLLDWLLA